jgi:superfamily II DNA or RNA helicase
MPGPLVGQVFAMFRLKNPDFDANVHDPDEVPPYVEFFDESERRLLTGLVPVLQYWALHNHEEVELIGWPYDPSKGWAEFPPEVDAAIVPGITLKPYQVEAVAKALQFGRGILEMATGSGKSEAAIAITLALGIPKTLYVVPDCAAMYQMYDRYVKRGFNETHQVGRLGDTLCELDRPVTIAVINSLFSAIKTGNKDVLAIIGDSELLFLDEVHHLATAMSWQVVALQCPAVRRYGLSGTPYKNDQSRGNPHYLHPHDSWLAGLVGDTLVYVPPDKLQDKGELTPCEIVSFRAGGEEIPDPTVYTEWQRRQRWTTVYKRGVIENHERNERIVQLVSNLVLLGGAPLISIQRLEHGRAFQRMLYEKGEIESACSYGGGVTYLSRKLAEWLNIGFEDIPIYDKKPTAKNKKSKNKPKITGYEDDFVQVGKKFDVAWHLEQGHIQVIIGSAIYDEAQDIPILTDLVNAAGGKAPQRFRQKVGRVLRLSDGKKIARVWEPWDSCHALLLRHSEQRLKTSAAQGYPVVTNSEYAEILCSMSLEDLKLGVVRMKTNEVEVTIDLTIPVSGQKDGKFCFVKPRVSLRAELEDGDDVAACTERLSADCKALFVQEALKQATLMSEVLHKGFVATAKEYLEHFEAKSD